MKKIAKFLACAAVALFIASCGSTVESAKKAIENGDFVEAAECLGQLSVDDINSMEAAEQIEVMSIGVAIEMSGNDEASKILNEKIDLDKVEVKKLDMNDLIGL